MHVAGMGHAILDAHEGHWVELHGPGTTRRGPVGWTSRCSDDGRGLWTVEDRPSADVALLPTDAKAVLDQLAALPGHVGLGG
jgi:hypothetical protein